jgi:hypothetical protein
MYRPVLSSLTFAVALVLSNVPQAEAQQVKVTPTREVAPPGTEAYSTIFSITVTGGSGTNFFSPDVIPANRRLVIEFVSVSEILQPGEKPLFTLDDSLGGASHPFYLPLQFSGSGSVGDQYRATQLVKYYFDGNGVSGPGATCGREQNSFNFMECTVVLSGYLIPR